MIGLVSGLIAACAPSHRGATDSKAPGPQTTIDENLPVERSHGTMDGAGGNVVVCLDAKKKIKSIELLDLFEARALSHLTLMKESGKSLADEWLEFARRYSARFESSEEEQDYADNYRDGKRIDYSAIKSMKDLKRMHNRYGAPTMRVTVMEQVLEFGEAFEKNRRFVSSELKLKRIDDSHEVFSAQNCFVDQVVNYQSQDTILIQSKYWDRLSSMHQAALMAHEFIYREYRARGATDSVKSRRMVGLLFSTQPSVSAYPQPSKTALYCQGEQPAGITAEDYETPAISVDFAQPSPKQVSLFFYSYPGEILIEPVTIVQEFDPMFIWGGEGGENLRTCVAMRGKKDWAGILPNEEKKDGFESSTTSLDAVRTSYFKNDVSIDFQLSCGPKVEGDVDLRISITPKGRKDPFVYRCGYQPALDALVKDE